MPFCTKCGAPLDEGSLICSKCGSYYQDNKLVETQTKKETNVFSILGIIFAFVFGLIGIGFGIAGIVQSKKTKSGLALSVVAVILSVFTFLIAVYSLLVYLQISPFVIIK